MSNWNNDQCLRRGAKRLLVTLSMAGIATVGGTSRADCACYEPVEGLELVLANIEVIDGPGSVEVEWALWADEALLLADGRIRVGSEHQVQWLTLEATP